MIDGIIELPGLDHGKMNGIINVSDSIVRCNENNPIVIKVKVSDGLHAGCGKCSLLSKDSRVKMIDQY